MARLSQSISGDRLNLEVDWGGDEVSRYYFHVCGDQAASFSRLMDGPMFMFLLPSMLRGQPLHVDGRVTARALRNAHLFQEAWVNMRPEQYKRIDIHPKKVLPEMLSLRLGRTRAMAAFSGGIDGSFSAIRHAKKMLGLPSYPVTHVLHIHGLDVDADRQDQFDKLLLRTAPLIADAGVKRVVVKTNIRKPTPCKWEDGFGAIVAGILHMVGSRFRYGMIGSSEPYSHPLVPWGSTPGTDYLLSGGKMDIVHDGAGYTRTEKAAFLAGYPSAISGMRVCYSGEEQHNNCGTCEKCVRTRLNFMAVGVDDPPLFDTPFTLEMIDGLAPKNSRQRAELETIVAYAESRKTNAVWLRNLKARLSALC